MPYAWTRLNSRCDAAVWLKFKCLIPHPKVLAVPVGQLGGDPHFQFWFHIRKTTPCLFCLLQSAAVCGRQCRQCRHVDVWCWSCKVKHLCLTCLRNLRSLSGLIQTIWTALYLRDSHAVNSDMQTRVQIWVKMLLPPPGPVLSKITTAQTT